ncbi:endonuclease [Desulfuromonas carbonis]|uniref:endonuclease III domain-containing protein n=1 Tax=Desulfuromonas sp. DDH964 TaxID=1823759 RepID=UPI00078EF566|nr:endonuclease [Desulfuromonas sp. DDH964]AMV71146.1 endonuclease III-like protein [Desulfuromonas sp. DDH964]
MKAQLLAIFELLQHHFGPRHWWPAESPFEVVIGAILTQNTAWRNVEQAIANLRAADALTPRGILDRELAELEAMIRPAGFFRQKAARLTGFARYLEAHHHGDLPGWLGRPLDQVRAELLRLPGIGPESADAILLYAGQRPSFVVDAYTRRLLGRLGLLRGSESYHQVRSLFMTALPPDTQLFNEFHALIVEECKVYCRTRPRCPSCPLRSRCPAALPG